MPDQRFQRFDCYVLVVNTISVLSHNSPYFPCNIAITNFLVSYTCEIRFHDVTDRTVHMFTSSYAKIPKHGQTSMFLDPYFLNLIR